MSFTPSYARRAAYGKRPVASAAIPADWAPRTSPCASCGVTTIHSIMTVHGNRQNPVIVCNACRNNPEVNLVAVIDAAKAAH